MEGVGEKLKCVKFSRFVGTCPKIPEIALYGGSFTDSHSKMHICKGVILVILYPILEFFLSLFHTIF